jgi:hypothetical protein
MAEKAGFDSLWVTLNHERRAYSQEGFKALPEQAPNPGKNQTVLQQLPIKKERHKMRGDLHLLVQQPENTPNPKNATITNLILTVS